MCFKCPDLSVTQCPCSQLCVHQMLEKNCQCICGSTCFHNAYFAQWNINSLWICQAKSVTRQSRVVRYVLFTCLLRKVTSQPKRNDTKIIFLTGSTNIFGHFLQWAAGNIELMGSLMQVMDLSRLPPHSLVGCVFHEPRS